MIRGRTVPVFTGKTRYIWSTRSRGFAVFSGPSGVLRKRPPALHVLEMKYLEWSVFRLNPSGCVFAC